MSFDQDPNDAYKRILCHHNASDTLFEVFSEAEFVHCNGDGEVDDVTGIDHYEDAFKKELL